MLDRLRRVWQEAKEEEQKPKGEAVIVEMETPIDQFPNADEEL